MKAWAGTILFGLFFGIGIGIGLTIAFRNIDRGSSFLVALGLGASLGAVGSWLLFFASFRLGRLVRKVHTRETNA